MLLLKTILLLAGLALALSARWQNRKKLALFSPVSLLLAMGLTAAPQGEADLRVNEFGRVSPHTLYQGVYWVWPFFERLDRFETRDRVYGAWRKGERLQVNTREGLRPKLGIALRYRLDPEKLAYLQGVQPAAFEETYIAPVVASQFAALAPQYGLRELISAKREEYRAAVACSIARILERDGIVTGELLMVQEELPSPDEESAWSEDCD